MTAYLTCELKSRDLDSRLLVAGHVLKAGVDVVVGQQWSLNANTDFCPKGAFLFKTANRIQAAWTKQCKAAGHSVVLTDEEILPVAADYIVRLYTNAEAVSNCDIFLFQDERHKNVVESICPSVRGEIVGNVRVDLLRSYPQLYAAEASALMKKGRYVLFNTGLTLSNSIWGSVEAMVQMAVAGGIVEQDTEHGRQFVQDWIESETAGKETILALIAWMKQSLPEFRVVVRPHPAENPATWQSVAGIEIVAGSNPIPWIMGSDLVIHTNSTTGLEAALLDKPCLNISRQRQDTYSKSFVPGKINFTVTSVGSARQAIDAFLRRGQGPLKTHNKKPSYRTGAARQIADHLVKLAPETFSGYSWKRHERFQAARDKFTVSVEEFAERASAIFTAIGLKKVDLSALDDSLFLLKS